ncbi:MAG: YbaK/EbsC family protein [Pseudomonadota bacterium]|nr:YbaK/prolyl-tRNA synthetase associated domain-containing protein [Gammaproteobacteria bacterium]MBU1559035.1 YbaK/prolyl-tRNA synthetase associated domain-containing protein [Gammaproteobacteria bacterium]MBU1926987.1 YbaK/prolyl-tRNA synthetase associated domain-containing protein [Gammaproteobacteria bacterium]MBU2546120.1 YbaK/prolyl-tRNA synthetase associated domain-containing protein [Gammaproteobacteria bacterium]
MFHSVVQLLQKQNVPYQIIEHAAAGRSEEVSKIRGTLLCEGAKAMVLKGIDSNKTDVFFLAILPADKNIDLGKVKKHFSLKKITFASPEKAQELTQCEIGAIPPFSFHEQLKLLVDEGIKKNARVAFNAGSLTQSVILNTPDYLKVVTDQATFFDFAKQPLTT